MVMLRTAPQNQDFQNDLLYASKFNVVYDRQCENDRVTYLCDLIRSTPTQAFFRDELLRCLAASRSDSECDTVQVFGILCKLAERDPEINRTILNDYIVEGDYDFAINGSWNAFVYLEGLDGLLLCARQFGRLILERDDVWLFRSMVSTLRSRDGAETVSAKLATARLSCLELEQLMRLDEAAKQPTKKEAANPIDYTQAKATLDVKQGFPRSWIKAAPVEELIQAADDLQAEVDDQRAWRYLQIFGSRDYPQPAKTLFDRVKSTNKRVAGAATRALGRLSDPEIRGFAFALLEEDNKPAISLKLLRKSFVPDDLAAVQKVLNPSAMGEDEWHAFGFAVLDLISNQPVSPDEYRAVLFQLYETTPCSLCRFGFVEKLLASGGVPDWMAGECLFDAEPDTAALVHNMSSNPSQGQQCPPPRGSAR